MSSLTYLQAIVIGIMQGLTELFPVSSLGHSVLIPAWLGGSWETLVTEESSGKSPYLAFIVGLHVATALALLVFYWKDWLRIIGGFFTSIGRRRIQTSYERLAWLLVIATIPAGLLGLAFEHALRVVFAKPLAAACFLTLNGLILLLGERLRRRAPAHHPVDLSKQDGDDPRPTTRDPLDVAITQQVSRPGAVFVGIAQSAALLAGISRSGITMVAGLLRGLTHEEAVRFSFLLATPVILAAGLVKVPDLFGTLGNGIRGEVLAGSIAAFLAALLAATLLVRWVKTRTLTPFAVYCLVFGVASIIRFA